MIDWAYALVAMSLMRQALAATSCVPGVGVRASIIWAHHKCIGICRCPVLDAHRSHMAGLDANHDATPRIKGQPRVAKGFGNTVGLAMPTTHCERAALCLLPRAQEPHTHSACDRCERARTLQHDS